MKVNEIRSMLAYLGVEYVEQPKKLGEIKFLLHQYENVEPEKYAEAYDVVVNGKQPKNLVPKEYESTEAFIKERTETYENNSIKQFAEKVFGIVQQADDRHEAHIAKIKKQAANIWREEAAKHRTLVVSHESTGKRIKLKAVLPPQFDDMLELADERENIMMVGPAGAGKTFLAGQLAEALDLPFATQSCSAGISESAFSGWLLPTGSNGNFEHNSVPFLDVYENGGVFLFDEFDAADPNVLTFLNQALANGSFDIPQRIGNPHVIKHENFVAIAACNTFGGGADALYHARNALDAATLDRFKMGMTIIDYDARVEESLITESVLYWGRKVRELIEQHNLKRIMSTRVLIGATKMLKNKNWSIDKIAGKYFQDWSKEELSMARNAGLNTGGNK